MIFILIIALNLYIKIATSELTVFRGEPYFPNQDPNIQKQLLCISDNPDDAIIWNTDLNYLNWDTPDVNQETELSTRRGNINEECGIGKTFERCFSTWVSRNSTWSLIDSLNTPMGPVFDSRWEHFSDHTNEKFRNIAVFGYTDALVFSIRGSGDAHILLYDVYRPTFDFLYTEYWLIIGGWNNNRTLIKECTTNLSDRHSDIQLNNCNTKSTVIEHQYLHPYEWNTFVLLRYGKTLKLFDPNRLILTHTLRFDNDYDIYYKSTDKKMLFRFHDYTYRLATKPGAMYRSPSLLGYGYSEEICIDMLVGLCKQCKMIVNLIDGWGRRQLIKIIMRSELYKNVEHNLTMWEHQRLTFNVSDNYQRPILIELKAASSKISNEVGNHWAIAKFKECIPEGTIKRLKMTSQKECDGNCFWPTVKCQRLSYNSSHLEVVDTALEVSTPPSLHSNLEYCPKYAIGPHCATQCDSYFKDDCSTVIMCNKDRCICTQGFNGSNCNHTCTQGTYGYGCTNKCNNCAEQNCNPYTGTCESGCIKSPDHFFIPPYCNNAIDIPVAPLLKKKDETSVDIFVPKNNNYIINNSSLTFRLESIFGDNVTEDAIEIANNNINGTIKNIYHTIFTNLKPGYKYSVKMIITIEQDERIEVLGETVTFMTLCNLDKKFEIIAEERNLLVKRIYEQDKYSCADSWYTVELSKMSSNKSEFINIDYIERRFPMFISSLTPFTRYKVCIKGSDNEFNYCKHLSTLEEGPLEVRNLKVSSVKDTEVEITWNSPNAVHGILQGYNLTIQVIYYIGCFGRYTPRILLTTETFSNIPPNDSVSYKIADLIPYVSHEVTVLAYNSKVGSKSSINFNTREREIPTAVFSNLNFWYGKISWTYPQECGSITGPIKGARVLLFGLSENIQNFRYEFDTEMNFLYLSTLKRLGILIYGNEIYHIKIHTLREINGTINETAYSELSFLTDPTPPPKVQNLQIVEVDNQKQMTTLRWEKPPPPTNGEIIYYTITFLIGTLKLPNEIKVFPNETCYLWPTLLCKIFTYPSENKKYIEVRAYNKGVNTSGEATRIDDVREERAPEKPEIITIKEFGKGEVYLKWQHPTITGGPMKKFLIHREIISTQLEQNPNSDETQVINIPILNYQIEYDTHLYLSPSTLYKISVEGVGNVQSGKLSSVEIETNSSLAFEYEPKIIVNNETSQIQIVIPPVINNTKDSTLHIIVKGPSTCKKEESLNINLINDIGIGVNDEPAWYIANFSTCDTKNLSFTIGHEISAGNSESDCHLHIDVPYIIMIAVVSKQQIGLKKTASLVWKSQPLKIYPILNKRHEYWVIPLLLLIIMVIGGVYYYLRRRNVRYGRSVTYEMSDPIEPVLPE